jgi:phosphopantetheine--protein transferase-like protein
MIKAGVDIIRISRMRSLLADPAAVSRAFCSREMAVARSSADYARIIALKEAFFKAAQVKISRWSDICVSKKSGNYVFSPMDDSVPGEMVQGHVTAKSSIRDGYAIASVLIDR